MIGTGTAGIRVAAHGKSIAENNRSISRIFIRHRFYENAAES